MKSYTGIIVQLFRSFLQHDSLTILSLSQPLGIRASLMPFLSQITGHPAERIAVIDSDGEHSFGSLVTQARLLAGTLKEIIPTSVSTNEPLRIAFLAGRQASSAVALLAIWLADAVAVPLDPLMSLPEWQWRLEDLTVEMLIHTPSHRAEAQYIAHCTRVTLISTEHESTNEAPLRLAAPEQSALILFSNKGGVRPKPCVHSFRSLAAQMQTLVDAWEWQPEDRLLHVLPLSNYHGLIHGLLGSMAAGCCCEILPNFKINLIWNRLSSEQITLFTAVPTIYQYLIDAWNKATDEQRFLWQVGFSQLRQTLVGPGSVAPSVSRQWSQITSQDLHFHFGMTETGMIIHNKQSSREISGEPMPGVNLRLADDLGHEISEGPGELEIRTPQLFKEYFGHTDLTQHSYNDGWFRTGDLAIRQGNNYRLLGHRDLDVIDTGGYRVSALEIETVIDSHPGINKCAILGTPCERWGEAICVFIVPEKTPIALAELREWLCPQLPSYKLPTQLTLLTQMPRTHIGAVDKQQLKRDLTSRSLFS